MRNALLGAALVAVIAGLIAHLVWGRQMANANNQAAMSTSRLQELQASPDAMRRAKPRNAVITLKQDPATGAPMGRCVASIDVQNMGGSVGEDVKWCVVDGEGEDQANQCRPSGAWAVYLVFDGDRSPFRQPDHARRVRVGRGCKVPKIADDVAVGRLFDYKIFMRPHAGDEYPIVDPDIEIEPPGVGPRPPSPPAKK